MQVKVNFTVAERCHYHHATRAYKPLRLRFYSVPLTEGFVTLPYSTMTGARSSGREKSGGRRA